MPICKRCSESLKFGSEHICKVKFEEIPGMSKIKVLEMIAEDMKNDAAAFDGQPFDGKTVARYFGNQGAAIATLAKIIKSLLEDKRADK